MPSWKTWKRIPGGFKTDTMASVAVYNDRKRLYVVARRPSDNTIWFNTGNENPDRVVGLVRGLGRGHHPVGADGQPRQLRQHHRHHPPDPCMAVLAVGTDDIVYINRLVLESNAWTGCKSIGGLTDAPVFGFDAVCSFRCFARGIGDSGVYMNEVFTEDQWSGWKHVPGTFKTDFTITPSRPEWPAEKVMALLGVRQSDKQVCVNYLDFTTRTGTKSEIEHYPSGWNPLPYSAKTNAPLAAALTRGFAGFAKGGSDGKIFALTGEDGCSQVPGNGVTDAGLSSATIVLSRKVQSTITWEFVRNVLVAKGVEDGEIYFNSFDEEFKVFYLDAI